MGLVVWIIFGAMAGWIASIIMGTDERQGGFTNVIVGVVGAIIGGAIATQLGIPGITGFNVFSFVVAVGGAMLLIGILQLFSHSTHHIN